MSNEFEYDPTPAWTYTDGDGDRIEVEPGVSLAARGRGEDVFVHTPAENGAYANARELIDAIQKAAGLDLTIVNNVVYREYFGGNPGSETPIGTVSGDGIRLEPIEPDPSIEEDLFTLLVELYAELKLAGASKETLALVVKRIRRQVMQEQVLRAVA